MKEPRLPAWAWVFVLWATLVALGALLETTWGLAIETCLFRRVTGHPCPTCGSTRAVLALLGGDWRGSLRLSPLLWLAGIGLAGWGMLRLVRGSRPLPARIRPWLLGAGLLALVVNWIWVLRTLP